MLKSSRPGVFYKKDVLKNFEKFIGAVSFIKVTGSQPAALLKKRLQRRSFLVNLSIFLRTPFFKEHLQWLILYALSTCVIMPPRIIHLLRMDILIHKHEMRNAHNIKYYIILRNQKTILNNFRCHFWQNNCVTCFLILKMASKSKTWLFKQQLMYVRV